MNPTEKLRLINENVRIVREAEAQKHAKLIEYFHNEIARLHAAVFENEETRLIAEEYIRQIHKDMIMELKRVKKEKEFIAHEENELQKQTELRRQVRQEVDAFKPKYKPIVDKTLAEGKHSSNPFVLELPTELHIGWESMSIKREALLECLDVYNSQPGEQHRYMLRNPTNDGVEILIL
jgi:hypothetical protein